MDLRLNRRLRVERRNVARPAWPGCWLKVKGMDFRYQ